MVYQFRRHWTIRPLGSDLEPRINREKTIRHFPRLQPKGALPEIPRRPVEDLVRWRVQHGSKRLSAKVFLYRLPFMPISGAHHPRQEQVGLRQHNARREVGEHPRGDGFKFLDG